MELEVLISAMNIKNEQEHQELIKKSKIKTKSLLINQITKEDIGPFNVLEGEHRLLSFREKGLSKSRNKAVANSVGDIAIICDDDIIYVDNYESIIKEAYDKNPDADIISFYIESRNPERPTRHVENGIVDFNKSLRICSCNITFKIDSLRKAGIKFNEMFGAGSDYYMGEENILLANALEKGLKIMSVDTKIADVLNEESTWYGTFDRNYFHIRGAVYYELSRKYYKDLIYDFAERKKALYEQNLTYEEAINTMLEGANDYIKLMANKNGEEE